MTFIESWLGVSPDGGDGSLEALYVALAAAAVLWLARKRIAGFLPRRAGERE